MWEVHAPISFTLLWERILTISYLANTGFTGLTIPDCSTLFSQGGSQTTSHAIPTIKSRKKQMHSLSVFCGLHLSFPIKFRTPGLENGATYSGLALFYQSRQFPTDSPTDLPDLDNFANETFFPGESRLQKLTNKKLARAVPMPPLGCQEAGFSCRQTRDCDKQAQKCWASVLAAVMNWLECQCTWNFRSVPFFLSSSWSKVKIYTQCIVTQ